MVDELDTEYESNYTTARGKNKVYCEYCDYKLEKRVSRYYCKHCNVYFKIKSKNKEGNGKDKKTKLDMPQDPTSREHNVSYLPDALEEYLDDGRNKPSGFFAKDSDVLSPTGRWVNLTESNPKASTTYSTYSKAGRIG